MVEIEAPAGPIAIPLSLKGRLKLWWATSSRFFHLFIVGTLAAITVALLVSSQFPFIHPWPVWINVDEAYIAAFGWRMTEGHWLPYVDAVSHRGPVLYWMAALFVKVLGPNWYAMRALGGLSLVWTGVGVIWAASEMRRPIAGLVAALVWAWYSLVVMSPGDGISFNGEPMLNAFGVGALVMLTLALGPRAGSALKPGRLFFAGALTACALLSKQVGGALVLPFFLWVAVAGLVRGWFWRGSLAFAGGCVAPVALTLLPYAVAGELRTFWYYFVVYNRDVYLAPYEGTYADVFRTWVSNSQFHFGLGLLLLAAWVGRVIGHGGSLRTSLRRSNAIGFEVTVFLAAVLSGFSSNGSLRGFGHYFLQIVPWAGLALGVTVHRLMGTTRGLRGGLAILLVIGPAVGWVARGWQEVRTRIEAEQRGGSGWQANTEAELCSWIERVSTSEDAILVWGFKAQAYINCHRMPATRYVFTTFPSGVVPWDNASSAVMAKRVVPGSQELMLRDLEESKAAVVVDAGDTLMHKSITQFAIFKKYLDQKYCPSKPVMGLPVWLRRAQDGTCRVAQ